MGIDITLENLIRLSEVPKLPFMPLTKNGKPIALSTVYRWVLGGTGGVKLESLKVGGTLCTSVEALQRFFDALSGSGRDDQPTEARHQASNRFLDQPIYGGDGKPGKMDAEMKAAMKDPKLAHLPPHRRRSILEAERRLREAGI
jgi:hypothetical protein